MSKLLRGSDGKSSCGVEEERTPICFSTALAKPQKRREERCEVNDLRFCEWVRLESEATSGPGAVYQRLIEATDRLAAAAVEIERLREERDKRTKAARHCKLVASPGHAGALLVDDLPGQLQLFKERS